MSEKEFLENLGKKISKLRNTKGFSQERFAAELDIDQSYLSEIETGKANPSILYIKKMAGALGLELWELLKF